MERSGLGGLDRRVLRAGDVVSRPVCTAAVIALVFLGCYDPFGPVVPETPTVGSTGKGSLFAKDVPVDFGAALDSGQSTRISALLTGSIQMSDGPNSMSSTQVTKCLDSLLSPSRTAPLAWNIGPVSQKLSTVADTAVLTFTYSLNRADATLASAPATWTVVQIGTEWKLQSWSESAPSSGWYQLCLAPR